MRPPIVADRLLAWLVPERIRRAVIGDLHEEYLEFKAKELHPVQAHAWYWRQLLSVVVNYSSLRRALYKAGGQAHHSQLLARQSRFGLLWQDIRYSCRALRKHPGFTVIAATTLALGVGANTAIFSVVKGVLLNPLPFEDPQELVVVGGRFPGIGTQDLVASAPEYRDYTEQAKSVSELVATWNIKANVTHGGRPGRLEAIATTPNLFSMLKVEPALGRDFLPDDLATDVGYVVILSHDAWLHFFNGDRDAIGRTLRIDDDPITVIGIMPPGFKHPGQPDANPVDVWAPINVSEGTRFDNRSFRVMTLLGRIQDGYSLEQSRAELRSIADNLRREYPTFYPEDAGWDVTVVSLLERVVGDLRATLVILFSSVGLVLLLTCSNVANLVLARGSARSYELALRSALGGSRFQVGRQLMMENVVLACIGTILALPLAAFGTRVLKQVGSASIPRLQEIAIDGSVLAFAAGTTLLAAMVFGLIPSVRLSRTGSQQLIKENPNGSGVARSQLRSGFAVTQIAVSLVILISAGLTAKSFARLIDVDPGFDPNNVLTMETWLPWPNIPENGRYFRPEQRTGMYEQALQEMESLREVTTAGLVSILPLRGLNGWTFAIEGKSVGTEEAPATAETRAVSPGYIEVMGIPLLSGRNFTQHDDPVNPWVVMINEAFAERYFVSENPIGQHLLLGGPCGPGSKIVGVVGNVLHQALDARPRPTIYTSYRQDAQVDMTFVLKTVNQPEPVAQAATEALQSVDRDLPTSAIASLERVVAETVAQRRLLMLLLAIFAAVSLFLAAIGVYGVITYTVRQRDREIGIRMAMGARRGSVLRIVLRDGLRLGLAGVLSGLAAAAVLTKALNSVLFEIGRWDPFVYGAVATITLAVVLVATLVPAHRATRVDPLFMIKSE